MGGMLGRGLDGCPANASVISMRLNSMFAITMMASRNKLSTFN